MDEWKTINTKTTELAIISNEVHRFSLHSHRVRRGKSVFGR